MDRLYQKSRAEIANLQYMNKVDVYKRQVYEQLANAKEEVGKPFPKEEELNQKLERLSELNALLNMDEREDAETEVSESDEKEERPTRGSIPVSYTHLKAAWETEYLELKTVLTPEEYAAARASTLNAHYTQPIVIESMYQVLENLGFTKGNILEPSMGVGNFFGMLPENLNQSKLYGVELDSISGRIAKLLYPDANIQIKGFEKTDYPCLLYTSRCV